MTVEKIKKKIEQYVGNDDYSNWYVGITNDIECRLFQEHGVDKDKDLWVWCNADSKDDAQDIEEYFLEEGMDGDTGGGNKGTTYVYVFKKNRHTDPRG